MNNNSQNIRKTISNYTYENNDLIGSGYSSKVYKGVNTKTNQVVAIKVISIQQLTTQISKSLLKNEIQVLSLIDHPNLMKIYDTFETKNNRYLICEYCNERDLAEILDSTQFTETQTLEVFQQIAQGIKALHDKKIIHRDIKPANILKSNGSYKLADFGFAVIENQYESIIKKFNVGTPMYMAPETAQNNVYSEKSDIWSLGIVLFQMIYRELPLFSKQENELSKKHSFLINKIKNDTITTPKTKELMLNMLNIDPEKRMSINEIIANLSIQPKKIQTLSHQSIPYRSIKTSYISQDLQQSRSQLEDQLLNNQSLSNNAGGISENQLKEHLNFKSHEIIGLQNLDSKKVIKINQVAQLIDAKKSHTDLEEKPYDLTLQINQINSNLLIEQPIKESYTQKIEAIPKPQQQSSIKFTNFTLESRLKNQKSLELIDMQSKNQELIPEQQLKQTSQKEQEKITAIKIPITTQNFDNNSNTHGLSGEENSTNDTINNHQFSNCHQILQEKQKIIDISQSLQKQSYSVQNSNSIQQKKSPVRVVQSQQNIMTPALKSSGLSLQKNPQENKQNCYFQTNTTSQFRQFASQTKSKQNVITDKFTSDFNSNIQDDKEEFLSASIRPTYKFLLYLNSVLKQFDCINTEDKQKCYFLIRKLLGIKATYVQKYCPSNKQGIIQGWIDNFLSFYSKVETVFYITPDKQFEQFFNKDLSEFRVSFSQLLLHYLQKINIVKLQKDFQVIQEILLENQKQNNDPIMFARRWENDQI
ncbi:unnamed protein product (macronuclear) [Paramecium tetraurelia]|uniref:Protein kinase domain-containing protein n=1 Tax=Paramecium tetraurelia TaxID=5888 RepID=A0C9K2_PARTE|nr:uncharacterized protein GSPATT00006775001 [Paramecium tetraurelia]CAK67469.1 unnamed protein product [Paramecium tetraurelia]|eukprot:XP_001434866.1 hypothetical protein (macronuclear) [Paramecium tetraurelia strain d4-2]